MPAKRYFVRLNEDERAEGRQHASAGVRDGAVEVISEDHWKLFTP